MVGRVRLLLVFLAVALTLVVANYWFVQGVQGTEYRQLAENNRLREVPIQAPRGTILEREGRSLAENIPSYNLRIDPRGTADLGSSLAFAGEILGVDGVTLGARVAAQPDGPVRETALVAEDLSLGQVAHFESVGLEHPEFEIDVSQQRLYRHREQVAHVLGYLGEVNPAELQEPNNPYQAGEQIGRRGIERQYQRLLRGERGERVVIVDSRGRPVGDYQEEQPRAGENLRLTIDLDLQQAAQRALGDRVGAIVVLDPQDGEVLVMASSPSYDPNLFARRLEAESWTSLVEAPHQPLQNRTLQNVHSPGSVFKVVMALGGLEEGIVTPETRVFCAGAKSYFGRRSRCWKRAGHGWVNLHEAIKRSCDIFFYDLGQQMGIDAIGRHARRFGLGEITGVDLLGEKSGLVPSREWSRAVRGHPWYPGETISVAIGQGPILATPLQIAVLMSAAANAGPRPIPWLGQEPSEHRAPAEYRSKDWQLVRDALRAVVMDSDGTGRSAAVPGLTIAGKTGTVQVVSQQTWVKSEDLPLAQRDHAWFASYAPVEDPRWVVVVFVEHGGAGSTAAAPIAKEVYEAILAKSPALGHLPAS
jgi:penicillin-binding protein 2